MATPRAHILVVEDDPDVRELIERQLDGAGYRITLAATGQSAVTSALADPPDVVIVDVQLPDIDGREVIQILRADDRTRRARILICSIVDPDDLGATARDAELAKPYRREQLSDLVGQLAAAPKEA